MGNRANRQFQLDALGESLLLFAAAAAHDRLDRGHWQAAEIAVDAIAAAGNEPDAGIWELDDRWWTHSRLTCVAGPPPDRRMQRRPPRPARGRRWPTPSPPRRPGPACTRAGAGNAPPTTTGSTPPCCSRRYRGALAADDPRTVATIAAIEDELGQDGYLYRFRHDERPLEDAEGAFSLCGFPLALAYHQEGAGPRQSPGSNATGPPAGPPDCSPRSSTSASASCAATSPRPSSTPSCSSAPPRLGRR